MTYTLYTWNTPNGQKPLILLEELGVDYDIVPIDIGSGDQHAESFVAINPNGRIPALTLTEGGEETTIFESGAILMTIAEREGRFLPTEGQARADALGWTFWQVGGLGPMVGQWGHFMMSAPEKLPYPIKRYLDESVRLLEVMDGRLADVEYLAGAYSIADMMCWPWSGGALGYFAGAGAELPPLTHLRRWSEAVGSREAVKKAMELSGGLAAMKEAQG